MSYELSGIYSDFSNGGASQTVTLSLYQGIPNSGTATLLASGTFTSDVGLLGVTFGSDVPITAGDTYFVGMSNTGGIGVDMANDAFLVSSAQPAAPGVTYIPADFIRITLAPPPISPTMFLWTTPPGGESCNNAFAAPILQFDGYAKHQQRSGTELQWHHAARPAG